MRRDGVVSEWLSMTAIVSGGQHSCVELTGVLVELDEELCDEASGSHDDERRERRVRPEQGRELRQLLAFYIVRDDEAEGGKVLGPLQQYLVQVLRGTSVRVYTV